MEWRDIIFFLIGFLAGCLIATAIAFGTLYRMIRKYIFVPVAEAKFVDSTYLTIPKE